MGLDTKTYLLTGRQSQSDFDFEFESHSEISESLVRGPSDRRRSEEVQCVSCYN
jgi:hypothetical protein